MWKALQKGWVPPDFVSEETYKDIRENRDKHPPALVGFVGFGCSYSGKWFGGYARGNDSKGVARNYTLESKKNVMRQVPKLDGVLFVEGSFDQIVFLPENSIVYCDPPYEGTTKYKDKLDHRKFWQWCREMAVLGHMVFISEYNAPDDFQCVWEKKVNNTLTKDTGSKQCIERLFIYVP